MSRLVLEAQNPWWKTGKFKRLIFPRKITEEILKNLKNKKILALVGSRQVGKTSILYLIIQHLLKKTSPQNILYFNLDDLSIQTFFQTPEYFLQSFPLRKKQTYIFIDEIQRLPSPGLFLKTLHDLNLNIKFIVSGSSQLELRSKLKEFLVGRIRQFEIPRLTLEEAKTIHPNIPTKKLAEEILLYGSYPEVSKEPREREKKLLLHDIHQTYLQKDVSDFAKIENIEAFNKLLILLANQIGNLLNVHNLSKILKISTQKIEHYIEILEGTFIIKRLFPFFQNYKKEITKTPKIYFLDLGLRNLLLNQWQELDLREDRGKLFENFVFLELYNKDPYKEKNYRFWRTTNQTEIDFVIQNGADIKAIEAKWSKGARPRSFKTFKEYYPKSKTQVITFKEL